MGKVGLLHKLAGWNYLTDEYTGFSGDIGGCLRLRFNLTK